MIDPTTVSLIAEAFGLGHTLSKLLKAYREKASLKENQQLLAKWRVGLQAVNRNRADVARLLHSFYGLTESHPDTFSGVFYVSPEGSRPLPLITREGLGRAAFRAPPAFLQSPPPMPAITENDLVEQISQWSVLGMRIFDAPIYSIGSASADRGLAFSLSRFLNYRPSYGALPDELILALADHQINQIADAPERYLPLRAKLLPNIETLTTFPARIAAGGPAVLFAVQVSGTEVGLLLQKRSFNVSDEPGVLTVVPKAFHRRGARRERIRTLSGSKDNGGN